MSETTMRERERHERRGRLYDSTYMQKARAEKQAEPLSADAMRRHQANEKAQMERRHRADNQRLSHKHNLARADLVNRGRHLPADFDRKQTRERQDTADRHRRERQALERKHLAERDHGRGR